MRQWSVKNLKDRLGVKGDPIISNRTDNESAKMATDKGAIHLARRTKRGEVLSEALAGGDVEFHRISKSKGKL